MSHGLRPNSAEMNFKTWTTDYKSIPDNLGTVQIGLTREHIFNLFLKHNSSGACSIVHLYTTHLDTFCWKPIGKQIWGKLRAQNLSHISINKSTHGCIKMTIVNIWTVLLLTLAVKDDCVLAANAEHVNICVISCQLKLTTHQVPEHRPQVSKV